MNFLVSTEETISWIPPKEILKLSWIEDILSKLNITWFLPRLLDLSSWTSWIWSYLEREWFCSAYMIDPVYSEWSKIIDEIRRDINSVDELLVSLPPSIMGAVMNEKYMTVSFWFRRLFLDAISSQWKENQKWTYISWDSEHLPLANWSMNVVFISSYLSKLWRGDNSKWKVHFLKSLEEISRVLSDNWQVVIVDYYHINWFWGVISWPLGYELEIKVIKKESVLREEGLLDTFSITFEKKWFAKLIRLIKSII